MTANAFISTTGSGLARAERQTDGSWLVENLLGEQSVSCLAADPLNPTTVYAGTKQNGVLRSTDAGKSWKPAGMAGQTVKAVSVSRVEPGTVYAGTKPARMYVSRDGGANWSELDSFRRIPGRWFWLSPAETPFTAYVQGIALSPTDANVLVVGIEAGAVVRSGDGGRSWTTHRAGAMRDCHSIIFHATSGNRVYEAGGTGAGAAISHDSGERWTQPSDGLDRHYGWACAADPGDPDVWYVSVSPPGSLSSPAPAAHVDGKANAGIYRKRDESPWERLAGGLPNPLNYMAYALITDPDAPGHLYAGLAHGEVWHSTDFGDHWAMLPFNLKSIHRAMIMV